jgi:hypothetical protein
MAGKSAAQRLIELIAVLAVAGCMVPIAIAVWGHFYKPTPNAGPETVVAPSTPPPPGPPQRARVDSVGKLPKTYPEIADVTAPRPATPDLRFDALRASVKIRHLNAYIGNAVFLSPDGQMAVVCESTPANTTRLALWNLGTGKLVRFLSGEEGKAASAYRGEENASFGVPVDFDQFREGLFSPDGKKFVACQGFGDIEPARNTYLWDVNSGKLLWKTIEPSINATLLFPSPEFLVVGAAVGGRDYGWRRIDAATGESELLTPPAPNQGAGFEGGAAFKGQVAFLPRNTLATLDVASRQLLMGLIDSEPKPRPTIRRLWYGRDGKQVFAFIDQTASLEVWDVASHKLVNTIKLKIDGTAQMEVYPAPAANLVGNRTSASGVDFFDITTGKRRLSIYYPYRGAPLKVITTDARRHLIQTDQDSLLVVDFTGDLPEGMINLTDLLGTEKLAATR